VSPLGVGVLAALTGVGGVAPSAPVERPDPARWSAELVDAPRTPGAPFPIRAVVFVEEGWRLYSLSQPPGGPLPTRIWLAEGQPWLPAGPVRGPDPLREFDPFFGMEVETYSGRVEFDLEVKGGGGPSAPPIQLRARYQMCNGERCLRPKTLRIELPVDPGRLGPASGDGVSNP
jgi:hypothetical protein